MILHGPGIPGPAVERGLSNYKSVGNNLKMDNAGRENDTVNHTGDAVNVTVNGKTAGLTETNATLRSMITSKYTNYNGYNLHDDLAFGWHPGTSEVHYGDHGDYHDHTHEDEDSYVVEHGADNHGDIGWHAGHGEHGYGYGENRHGGYDGDYGHRNYNGHGDYYGGGNYHHGDGYHGDHYGGEHHDDGHHQ